MRDRTCALPTKGSPRTQPDEALRRTAAQQLRDGDDRCGSCRWTFDPTDARHDGHARYSVSPFCRRCVDRCRYSEDAFHVCAVCRQDGGES